MKVNVKKAQRRGTCISLSLQKKKKQNTFSITQTSFYLWNIYKGVLYSGHIPFGASDYEVMLSVYFYWCVELGNDSDSPGLLQLKVPIFWRCAGSQSKPCAKTKYLDVIVPLRLATEHLSSSLLHSIWARCAPAARWQLTIALLAINQPLKRYSRS